MGREGAGCVTSGSVRFTAWAALIGTSPNSSRQTGRATFTASGFPSVGPSLVFSPVTDRILAFRSLAISSGVCLGLRSSLRYKSRHSPESTGRRGPIPRRPLCTVGSGLATFGFGGEGWGGLLVVGGRGFWARADSGWGAAPAGRGAGGRPCSGPGKAGRPGPLGVVLSPLLMPQADRLGPGGHVIGTGRSGRPTDF